jgi:hypothetical protein
MADAMTWSHRVFPQYVDFRSMESVQTRKKSSPSINRGTPIASAANL